MSEQEKKGISRREFLKDAGLVIGGATVGSVSILSSCKNNSTTGISSPSMTTVTVTPPPVTKLSEVAPSGLLTLNVNGNDKELIGIEPYYTLSFVLREKLGLVGTKVGCNEGECGTCAVIVDGKSVYSCIMLAMNAAGKKILTIEGLANGQTLGPIQQKFFDAGASQCGFCTPGFIMATKALLDEKPTPTLAEVKEGLSGHICGCGHTTRIVSAVSGAY